MNDPGIGEKRDELGRGSDQVRMFVSDTLIRVGHDATVRELARRMAGEGVGALVVTEGDQVHGIVSERDVVVAIAAGKDLDSTTAADIDSRRLVTCARHQPPGGRSAHDGALRASSARQRPNRAGRHSFGSRPSGCLRNLIHVI